MPKFKIGDRVVCVDLEGAQGCCSIKLLHHYTVSRIMEHTGMINLAEMTENGYYATRFMLLEDWEKLPELYRLLWEDGA